MRVSGFFAKTLAMVCAAGILLSANVMCQKNKSEKAGDAADFKQLAGDSSMTLQKKPFVDTAMTKSDTGVKTGSANIIVKNAEAGYYTCPMHPQIHQAKPGKCPICGMNLVFKKAGTSAVKMKTMKTVGKK